MNRIVLVVITSLISNFAIGQLDQSQWSILGLVTFDKQFDVDFGMELLTPKYSPAIMKLDGQEILLEGYFIALDGKAAQNHFMLSKFPQSTCFFCGKAGPETAAQVFLANDKKLEYTEDKVKIKGVLQINTTDPTGLLYTLTQAKVVE